MQQQYTVEGVCQAVQILFHTRQQRTDGDIKQADDFLKGFSKSHKAWLLSINILLMDIGNDAVLVFQMARILKSKLQYDFPSLNKQEMEDVYSSCVQIVKRYSTSSDRAVRITVALILVYLYIQTFDEWNGRDLLDFIINELGFNGQKELGPLQKFCFDVLDSWPQELIDNDRLVIDQKRKVKLIELVKKQSLSKLFTQLQQLWQSQVQETSVEYLIIRCYSRWVEFINQVLNTQERMEFLQMCKNCPIFMGALNSLQNEELQEKSQELVKLVISLIPKEQAKTVMIDVQNQDPLLSEIVQLVFTKTFQTFPSCQLAIKDELSDEISSYIKFYTKVGKKFIHQLIAYYHQLSTFFENYMIIFQDEQSDEYNEEMSTFWIKLFLTLSGNQNLQQIKPQFQTLLNAFLNASVKKIRVSAEYLTYYSDENYLQSKDKDHEDGECSDQDEHIIDDLKGQFELKRDVRGQIKEIMQYYAMVEDPSKILLSIADMIKSTEVAQIFEAKYQGIEYKLLPPSIQEGWATFEACLYMVNSVLPSIVNSQDTNGHQYIMQIMELYLGLQQTNYFVVKTTLKTIGEGGAELLAKNKNMIQRVFEYVYVHLISKKKSICKLASKTFVKICEFNADFVIENYNIFNGMLKQMSSMEQLDNLINGVAEAICSDQNVLLMQFESLCSVFAQNLFSLQNQMEVSLQNFRPDLNSDDLKVLKEFKKNNKPIIKQIKRNLDALTMIIRKVPNDEEEPNIQIQMLVVQVYTQLWPLLSYFVDKVARIDDSVAEKVVRLTKHTWRCTFNSFSVDLLTEVLRKFIQCYTEQPISSYIYSIEVIATVFYKYEDYRQLLQEAFQRICELTFSHLPKIQNFEEKPDLTEDFFGLLLRYAKFTPTLILQSQSLDYILKLTDIGIGVEHYSAAKSIYSWMEILFKFLNKNQDPCFRSSVSTIYLEKLSNLIIPMIPSIMNKLFQVIRQAISDSEVADYLFDIIKAIANIEQIDYQNILSSILNQNNLQLLTQSEKQEWIDAMRQKIQFNFQQSLRTYDQRQERIQTQYLELLNKRAIQHAARN